jgi:fibronectin type 3 domain-containing protein
MQISSLKFLTAFFAVMVSMSISAGPVGYWRFENGASLGMDASGSALTLTPINNPVATNLVTVSGAGRNFFTNGIPQTQQVNTQAVKLAGNNYLSGTYSAFTNIGGSQFTVEAFINITSFPSGTTVPIASQWEQGGSPAEQKWIFALRQDSSTGNLIRPRVAISSVGNDAPALNATSLSLSVNKDYYIALVFDSGNATIYLRDLTTTNLQVETITGLPPVAYHPADNYAPLRIGAFRSTSSIYYYFTGVIDEVRVLDEALGVERLLVTGGAPSITAQPHGTTNLVGTTKVFDVTVSGSMPLRYQWYKGATPISGATNHSLVLTNLQMTDAGNYKVVTTNSLGSVTSLITSLGIKLAPTAYYVATNGNDANLGTNVGLPFKTIQKAATLMVAGDECYIRGGIYRETVTPVESGSPGYPIAFMPYNGEAVVVSGADVMSLAWSTYSGSIYQATTTNVFRQLFVDGNMMNEARWPNAQVNDLLGAPRGVVDSSVTSNTDLTCSALPNVDLVGATLHLRPGKPLWEYLYYTRPVATYDSVAKKITWNAAISTTFKVQTGNLFYLYGKLTLLDCAGEWYLDTNTDKLYLWTMASNSPSGHTVEAKMRDEAFVLDDRSYVSVKGLFVFAAGISMLNTTNCVVDGCHLRYVRHDTTADWGLPNVAGQTTACGVSGSGSVWKNSSITYSSQDGIKLSDTGAAVTNCVIRNVNYYPGYDYSAVTVYGSNHKVIGNTLVDSGRELIWHPESSACEFAYNDMRRGMRMTYDGGGTYCNASDGAGTKIHHNWVNDSLVGIYVDNGSHNYIIYRNVCWETGAGIWLNSPAPTNNLVYNNTTIRNEVSIGFVGNLTGSMVINNLIDSSMANLSTTPPAMSKNSWYPPVGADYVPQAGSGAIDTGTVLPPYTDGYVGAAPDIGAYEAGAAYWTPGATIVVPSFPGVGLYAPAGLTVKSQSPQVRLNWLPADGALSYNVKRSPVSGGPYGTVASGITSDSLSELVGFTDAGATNGVTYYYVVTSVNGGSESWVSKEVSATPNANVDDQDPQVIYSGSWTQDADANYYAGTRSYSSTTGNYAQLTFIGSGIEFYTKKNPNFGMFDVYIDDVLVASNVDTYSATALYQQKVYANLSLAGGEHTVKIRLNGQHNPSAVSPYLVALDYFKIFPVIQPNTPTGAAGVAGDAMVQLTWLATTNVTSYKVKRAMVSGGNHAVVGNPVTTNFTDTGLVNGTLYYYVVSAVNGGGESTNSTEVAVRPVSFTSTNLTYSINAGQLQLMWPQSHTGWRLQSQTNPVGSGLGTNWVNVSSNVVVNTNQLAMPISSTNGSVFFRLVYP